MKNSYAIIISILFLSCFGINNARAEIKSKTNNNELSKVNNSNKIQIRDILRIMPDKKKFFSNDKGITWTEVKESDKYTHFKISSLYGEIEVKSDSLKNSQYKIIIFNIYGKILANQTIESNDFRINLSGVLNPLVLYRVEENGVTIQHGKLILNYF